MICCCCCCSTFVTCWQRARRGWQEWSCDCDKSACAVVQLGHKVPVEGTSVPRGPRSWILGRLRCGFGGFVGLVCCRENSRRSKQLDGNSGTVESRDREECLSGASRKMGMFAARGHGVLKKGRGRVGSLVQVLGGEALPVCQQPAERVVTKHAIRKVGPPGGICGSHSHSAGSGTATQNPQHISLRAPPRPISRLAQAKPRALPSSFGLSLCFVQVYLFSIADATPCQQQNSVYQPKDRPLPGHPWHFAVAFVGTGGSWPVQPSSGNASHLQRSKQSITAIDLAD